MTDQIADYLRQHPEFFNQHRFRYNHTHFPQKIVHIGPFK